jgi:hypothetical protein
VVTIDDARAVPQPWPAPRKRRARGRVSSLAAGHLILVSELRSALAELGRLDTRLTVVPRDLPEQERAMIGHWRCS